MIVSGPSSQVRGHVLALTGERTLPDIWHENYWFRRHEAVYAAAAAWLPSTGTVVDAGCGEGYGAASLSTDGRPVVGLDYDAGAVAHTWRSYAVAGARANLVALPLRTTSVHGVVSLQVVEHLWDQPRFVSECARVLTVTGVLVLSTPNRLTFSPGVQRGAKPLNPFHVNEYDPEELRALLTQAFADVQLLGLNHGPRLQRWEQSWGPIVSAQLAARPDAWSADLATTVRSVTGDDFVLHQPARPDCIDLVAIARRPHTRS